MHGVLFPQGELRQIVALMDAYNYLPSGDNNMHYAKHARAAAT